MKCCVCGKEFVRSCYSGEYSDVCSNKCFTEKFWMIKEDAHKKRPFIIIDGTLYNDAGYVKNPKDSWALGHGGRLFNIQLEDGTTIETNNLWCAGNIPENHREVLKDNAKFI